MAQRHDSFAEDGFSSDAEMDMAYSAGDSAAMRDADGAGDILVASPTSGENFKVAIRVRPPLRRELEGPRPFINVVRIPDHRSLTLCEHLDAEDARGGGVYSTQSFTFDYVYDPASEQRDVYEHSAQPAVMSVLQGYNATVIAYGQTGTGKTYTMEGFTSDEQRGIIPRATEEMFSFITSNRARNTKFQVRASYLQIYNEQISDLLKPQERPSLSIRQSKNRVFVEGLSEWVVRSPHEIYGLMQRGCSLRATGSTKMSELSSRSHAIFIIVVEIAEEDGTYKIGKLNIVDLAGSEKVRQTGVTGMRLKETQKINWSLHLLGNVIEALTDPKRKEKHVPYRNSKLTHLLTDSLGGNCKTTLIACLSPALDSYQESLSTLKFANRAKNIKNDATINEDTSDPKAVIARYERELRRLRGMLAERGVDPQLVGELEERQRRAEENRDAALEALHESSRAFDEEKRSKAALQERIHHLEDKLAGVVGGSAGDYDWHSAHEEDQAQVERYKHLLLKQRDVMLSLTTRVNERDESILRLQEEIDAYDAHVQRLEEALDATMPRFESKGEADAWLGKIRVGMRNGETRYRSDGQPERLLTADEKIQELVMAAGSHHATDGGGAAPSADLERIYRECAEAAVHRFAVDKTVAACQERDAYRARCDAAEERAHLAEVALGALQGEQGTLADRIKLHLTRETEAAKNQAAERLQQTAQDLQSERAERKRLARELEQLRAEVVAAKHLRADAVNHDDVARVLAHLSTVQDQSHRELVSAQSLAAPPSRVAPQGPIVPPIAAAQALEARRQQEALREQLEEKNIHISKLEEHVAHATAQLKETAQMKRSLATHLKDRKALKTILEQRVRVKLDHALQMMRDGDIRRADAELTGLANLVNASITAMESDSQ